MDRHEWPNRFSVKDGAGAPWPCPSCGQRALTVAAGRAHVHEGRGSSQSRDHPAWDPEWIEGRFVCILRCTCGEFVAVIGCQGVEQSFFDTADGPEIDYSDYFEPLLFEPALRVIQIPNSVPSDVTDHLLQSFRLFWADPGAASNHVRQAIESLLDFHGVKRTVISNRGKRVELKLHNRIELFATSRKGVPISNHLMAAKWVGNAGSHAATKITRDDVFDEYEIIEYVLREMFDSTLKRIARITKAINKTKKPRSASRKWPRIKSKK
jgi:hypothetical protein